MLIGVAASLLLLASGRVAGISGIVGNLLLRIRGDFAWSSFFVAGLIAAGVTSALVQPSSIEVSPRSFGALAFAGLCVGVGTRLGGGCTSGHGVCGISRLSVRAAVATFTFIVTGASTIASLRWFAVNP
jgi:uncharacterized membrane protein YedE/YeeE